MSREILPGLEMVRSTWGSNIYIMDHGQGLSLVDAGFPMDYKKIRRHLLKRGSTLDQLKLMIATHYHMDHVGSMWKLKETSGSRVAAHEEDAMYMEGSRPYEVFKVDVFRTIYYGALRPFYPYRYVQVDVILREGSCVDLLGGLEVIHVPGHTRGSILLYGRKKGILFSGDTIRNEKGRIEGPPPQFTPDMGLAWEGLKKKVFGLDFDVLLPGHGDPIIGGAREIVLEALVNHGIPGTA